jgi:hypothetical protein
MKGVSYSSLGGRRRGRKTRGRRRRGGATPDESAKSVAQAIILQLEPKAKDFAEEGVEADEEVTVTLPQSPENSAGVDELIRKLNEFKSGTLKGQASAALGAIGSRFGSLFTKGKQTAGAVTEILVPALESLKTTGTATVRTTPTGMGELIDRLKEVTGMAGGRSRKSRRYTRRR